MHMLGRLRRETHSRDSRWKGGLAIATASFALAGALAFTIAPTASAAPAGDPKAFANETDQATYQGFNAATLSDLTAKCPNGIAGTPGSDPSTKVLNADFTNDFTAGGTVHYAYLDNPNFASSNYTIQDCVAVYPADTFQESDFLPNGSGALDPASGVTKATLNKGVKVDAAAFSGVLDSTGSTYFNWTAPNDLVGGQWVCNFARDISTGHGGGGNRKTLPSCYQVPMPEVDPTAPTFSPGACGEQDTVTIPETADEGVTYYLDLPETIPDGKTKDDYALALGSVTSLPTGDHTVTAEDGEGVIGTWPYTASAVEERGTCNPTVTPNVPTHPTSACGQSDTYVIPVDDFFDFVLVTGEGEGEQESPIADGSHNLASGVVVHIRAVKHQNVSDTTTGTTDWEFTGRAITACPQGGGGGSDPTTTTTTTEAPTTTTTTEAPTTTTTTELILPFTPEPDVVTTTTTMAPAPELAFTGSNTGYLATMGLVLVGFGGLLFAGTSRKRRPNNS